MMCVCVCVFLFLSVQLCESSLLPDVTPEDEGKICVVIDLDETLVHSSFKVLPHTPHFNKIMCV